MCGCNKNKSVAPRAAPTVRSLPYSGNRGRGVIRSVPLPMPLPLPTVDTAIWGPSLWKILHTASVLSTSDAQMEALADVLAALRDGIPCPECSGHYNEWYSSHPLKTVVHSEGRTAPRVFRIVRTVKTTTTWNSLVAWILDLHNNVNTRKSQPTWTVEQVVASYGSLADAIEATNVLRGVIGVEAHSAIMSMLNALVA